MQSSSSFDLRLAGSLDVVSVEVQDSPAGQTSAPVSVPCRVPLDGLDGSADISVLESVGRALWRCTLGIQAIAELWRGSLQVVGAGGVLRLRLIIDSPDLAALPWELVYDETLDRFLALDRSTPIARFVRLPIASLPWPQNLPLRLLFTGASPSNLYTFDVSSEWADIETALTPAVTAGSLKVEAVTPGATPDAVLAELRRGVDLWHFAGHSNGNELIFCDPHGQVLAFPANELGQLLAGEGVRLAVLNACRTGAGGGQVASVAGALVRAGLPGVVANQADISDVAARAFSAAFYDAIAAGQPVDQAVIAARKAILAAGSTEWWMPALFMRTPEGVLFDTEAHYSEWSVTQKVWLRDHFASEQESRACFGQPLHVGDPSAIVIARKDAWAQLDAWYDNWRDGRNVYVITGEEGDGKTWTVASWMHERLESNENFPPVVFVPSFSASSNNPHALISSAVESVLGRSPNGLWERRLDQWMHRPEGNEPVLMLILDGINQHNDSRWWRKLLESLQSKPWRSRVAVVVTSRTGFWNDNFARLRSISHVSYLLPPYDDDELSLALTRHGLDAAGFDAAFLELLRKPRYLDMAVKHRDRIEEAGDFTPARLVYEDMLDKYQRKTGMPLSDVDFRDIIRELAAKQHAGKKSILTNEVNEILWLYPDREGIFAELSSGGVLKRTAGQHYVVNPKLLAYGLGLLLADDVLEASSDQSIDLREFIAQWLEPHAEMDIKSLIREVAAIHALETPEYPLDARMVLLHFWVTSQNPTPNIERSFVAYFPIAPDAYSALAEYIWLEANDNPWVQDLIRVTLQRWISIPRLLPTYTRLFERWLGFIHPNPHPFLGQQDAQTSEETKRKIEHRVGHALEPGNLDFHGYGLTIVEDEDLLRLGRLALAVMSTYLVSPFVHAIAVGSLADRIMGFHTNWELNKWVIRSAREPVWPSLAAEYGRLQSVAQKVAQQASYDLLTFVGDEATEALQSDFPDDLFPPHPFQAMVGDDPCSVLREWTRESLDDCLTREDISDQWIARKLQSLSLDPDLSIPDLAKGRLAAVAHALNVDNLWIALTSTSEQMRLREAEPALAAYVPDELANMARRTFAQIKQRKGMPLRQLAVYLREHYLVLGDEVWTSVLDVWSDLINRYDELDDVGEKTLMFMTPPVLTRLDANKQLDFVTNRPSSAPDWLEYQRSFKPVADWARVRSRFSDVNDAATLWRLLWFISTYSTTIPGDILEKVVALTMHDDTTVRGFALKILYSAQNDDAAKVVAGGQWYWNPSNGVEENHWGSAILSEHGHELQFQDLRRRIDPNLLGYALSKRGSTSEEVDLYARDIDQAWTRLFVNVPDLPDDTPVGEVTVSDISADKPDGIERIGLPQGSANRNLRMTSRASSWGGQVGSLPEWMFHQSMEDMDDHDQQQRQRLQEAQKAQEDAGNRWFAERFRPAALEAVIELHPELVDRWLEAVRTETKESISILKRARSFYEALCAVLLRVTPEKGAWLYGRLKQHDAGVVFSHGTTGIPILEYQLFLKSTFETVHKEWDQRLDDCKSDRDLLDVAIVAQSRKGREWMWKHIDTSRASSVLFRRARGLVLLGFSNDPRAEETLRELVGALPDTWLRWLAERSLRLWQTNVWAKHWFQRFLEVEDDVLSWSSFRLFLQCVDSRFAHWKQDVIGQSAQHPWIASRQVFLEINTDDIKHSIRDNEKVLREQFLGQKILERQAWPWL